MQSTTILSLLRVFLIVMGAFSVIWGINDTFGDGQQSSIGSKKIVGGIAFAAISGFIMTWAIKEVSSAEAQAGIASIMMTPLFSPFFNF